jgi:hypothetical protein
MNTKENYVWITKSSEPFFMTKHRIEYEMKEEQRKEFEKRNGKQQVLPKKQQIRTYNKTSEQEAEKELKTIAKNFQKENNRKSNNSRNKNKN